MSNTIYIGGLPGKATEEELRGLIEPHGPVQSIAIPRDAEMRETMGYAFVEMADETDVSDVVAALNGVKLDDHVLSFSLIASSDEGFAPRRVVGPARIASMQEAEMAWGRLERWLEINANALWYSLYPLALNEEIQRAETALGLTLPDDIHVAYRRHNGQDLPPLFPNGFKFCTLMEMVDLWQLQNKMAEQFNDPGYWHPKWAPLISNDCGAYFFANLNSEDPDFGRIFYWSHDCDPSPRTENFAVMVEELAEGLESGKYRVEESGVTEASAHWI